MRYLWKEDDGSITVMAGSKIYATILEAIALAREENRTIKFEFNGVAVSVVGKSNADLIHRDWVRALNGYIAKNVGPNPKPILSDEEKANDDRIEAKNEQRRLQQQEEYEAEVAAKNQAVEAKLKDSNHMEFADEEAWKQFKDVNRDGYGSGIISYAERWALLMQAEMSTGKRLEDVADATSYEADTNGISGFMYGCAVSTLARCWKYGDQLRRWHNSKPSRGTRA